MRMGWSNSAQVWSTSFVSVSSRLRKSKQSVPTNIGPACLWTRNQMRKGSRTNTMESE